MGVQMDKTSIIGCSVIGVVGLLSAIFGFSAEGTKLNEYNLQFTYDYDCFYPPNPAAGLGICAAIFLLLSQVIISVVGGCCGCCKSRAIPSETKKIVGIICAVFSWIAAVIAMALFINGASYNTTGWRSASDCKVVKEGIFAGSGILALVATALGITSFIMLRPSQTAVQPPPPDTPVTATPNNMPGGYAQSPSPNVVVGQPLLPLPPSNKPQPQQHDYPVKPHPAYQYQQQPPAPPTHHSHHPQAGDYVQNMQPPPPPLAAAQPQPQPQPQHNVSYAPNHQQHLPAAAPAVAVAAAAAPVVAMGMGQQPLPLHQAVPLGGAAGMIPGGALPGGTALPSAGSGGGAGLATVMGHEAARQGVKIAMQAVANTIFSDNPVLSAMTDSAGTSGGDAVEVAN